MSAITAKLAREGATLDEVQGDISNLYDLLEVLFDAVTDFTVPPEFYEEKGRLSSLTWIARDIAKRACDEMEANSAVISKASQLVREGGR